MLRKFKIRRLEKSYENYTKLAFQATQNGNYEKSREIMFYANAIKKELAQLALR